MEGAGGWMNRGLQGAVEGKGLEGTGGVEEQRFGRLGAEVLEMGWRSRYLEQ